LIWIKFSRMVFIPCPPLWPAPSPYRSSTPSSTSTPKDTRTTISRYGTVYLLVTQIRTLFNADPDPDFYIYTMVFFVLIHILNLPPNTPPAQPPLRGLPPLPQPSPSILKKHPKPRPSPPLPKSLSSSLFPPPVPAILPSRFLDFLLG
jgi:hypothetical protein